MLNFYREHSRIIANLTAYQFGSAFFAIMLVLAIPDENLTMHLCASIFSVVFLLFISHAALWEYGAKNRIRIDAGRAKYDPQTGLLIGLAAGAPNILLGVIIAITAFLGSANGPVGWEWAGNVCGFANVIARFWQAMYLGIIRTVADGSHYIFLLTPLPSILGCFISYLLGLKNFRMFGPLTPKDKSRKS